MFQVGDKIVHPMHGAGVIDSIITKKVDGISREYYNMKLPVGGMLVMIPVQTCADIGVRGIISSDEADKVIQSIPEIQVDTISNWNQRHRENMLRLKSGDLMEVARVIKGLVKRENVRSLSTSERKMLYSAKQILISELALAQETTYEEVESRINRVLV